MRSLKGLQLLKEAFARLQWEAFYNEDDRATKYKDLLDTHLHLKEEVAATSPESVCPSFTHARTTSALN